MLRDTALVVDDDPIACELLASCLRVSGFEHFVFASHGAAALDELDRHGPRIGLMTCDLVMPGIDGIDVVSFLAERGHQIPLIIVSSAHEAIARATGDKAIAAGLPYLGRLGKPFSAHEVHGLVAQCAPKARKTSAQTRMVRTTLSRALPA